MCDRCNVELAAAELHFSYLEHDFHHKVMRCPSCGQVYLPEDLVNGKVKQLETTLEEK